MSKAKSCKIVLFLAVIMFVFAAITFTFPVGVAKADSAASYFEGITGNNLKFDGGNVVATVSGEDELSVKNALVLNELAVELTIPAELKALELSFNTEAFVATGNEHAAFNPAEKESETNMLNQEAEYVKHSLKLVFDGATPFNFNGADGTAVSAGAVTIYFKVVDDYVQVSVNDKENGFIGTAIPKLKVKNIDKCIAFDMVFGFETDSGVTANFEIVSVDQKYTDETGNYKQTFEINDAGNLVKQAYPRVKIADAAFVQTSGTYLPVATKGVITKYGTTAYSLLGKTYSLGYMKDDGANIYLSNEDVHSQVMFNTTTDNKLYVGNGVVKYEEYTFLVLDDNVKSTNVAPYYLDATTNALAIESYKKALQKATLDVYGDNVIASIRLGEELKLPSMRSLVNDDYTPYGGLSYTIYYNTPERSGSSTDWEIPIDAIGEYSFYVVFEDIYGDKMETDDFYTIDDGSVTKGKYFDYVFSFVINDDAPISVNALAQTKGYVGTSYTFSSFRIEASDYTAIYELFYNSNINASTTTASWEDSWVKIPAYADVDEEDSFEDGLTYEQIEEISYNGMLTFKPNKMGAYAIKCTVISKSSGKAESAVAVVKVNDTPKVVKPDNKWLENNIWSVVFLAAGTLCLIGVVALLFVKPKEER